MNNILTNKIKGFTLAEVLVTLAVIGIVAALTIPGLTKSYQNRASISGLKKFTSDFTAALRQFSASKNCINDLACTGAFDETSLDGYTSAEDEALSQIAPFLSIVKLCNTNNDTTCHNNVIVKNLNSADTEYSLDNSGQKAEAILKNGMILGIDNFPQYTGAGTTASDENCSVYSDTYLPGRKICGTVMVDVNGYRGPNTKGRDIFMFYITNEATLLPYGTTLFTNQTYEWSGTNKHWNCSYSTESHGNGCAARIMENSWQIDY